MIVARAPLRMSFLGGGSDLSAYYEHNQGAVLTTTLDKYVYVGVNRKFDESVRLSYSITEICDDINDLKHPIVRHVLNSLNINKSVEIVSVADIPSKGSGLGSSSSFTVALLQALAKYIGSSYNKQELAQIACRIEIDKCGAKIGKQDQYAAAYGGMNFITFNPDGSVQVEPLNLRREIFEELQRSIVVFFTGKTRSASDVLVEQSQNLKNIYIRDVTKKMVDAAHTGKDLLEQGDLKDFGLLLHESWQLKKKLASGISNLEINEAYEKGLSAGAFGGKLLGAGNGGFMMFLAPERKHDSVINALSGWKHVPFKFSSSGAEIILDSRGSY